MIVGEYFIKKRNERTDYKKCFDGCSVWCSQKCNKKNFKFFWGKIKCMNA